MKEANYDESLIPDFVLPDVLQCNDGTRVCSAFDWVQKRRPEVLDAFRKTMFGCLPPRPDKTYFETLSVKEDALNGTAIRKEIRLNFAMNDGKTHSFVMLLYIPRNAAKPVPVYLGLNFKGNHNCTSEADVMMTGFNSHGEIVEKERSNQVHRWQFEETVKRGFASATVCYHDIYPDEKESDSWRKSIYNLFFSNESDEEFHTHGSAISAWAWGLSRMLDFLEGESAIDCSKAMVHGHSRLGKTSLWAGANDTRFKLVVSNDSGCSGAAISRRCIGETVEIITHYFPHWFVSEYYKYANRELELPLDQHWLISLIAPRYGAIASAVKDTWADPKGEFLSGAYANDVYKLFGTETYSPDAMPEIDTYLTSAVSYHIRTGGHDQTLVDWTHYWEIGDKLK